MADAFSVVNDEPYEHIFVVFIENAIFVKTGSFIKPMDEICGMIFHGDEAINTLVGL
jgi:hypothetical protein